MSAITSSLSRSPLKTLTILSIAISGCATHIVRADWMLVWSDEFNGSVLDTNYWSFDLSNCDGWGNNELEYYTSSTNNAYLAGGSLHIAALKQPTNGFLYTSSRVTTSGADFCTDLPTGNGSYSFLNGRVEVRAKLPSGPGFWPAIWMLPIDNATSPYGNWPQYGEIDIMENNGMTLNYVKGNVIYNGGHQDQDCFVNDITQWHVYALEWFTNRINWLVDGVTNGTATTWNPPSGYAYPAPFDRPFMIILNVAIGGSYTDSDTNHINASLPGEMVVDYVRVYRQTGPILSVAATNYSVIVSWFQQPDAWVLEQASTTTDNIWTQVSIGEYQTNQSQTYIIAPTPLGGSMFYRLRKQ
jgi:beta-glucanase (GH16 family)